MSTPSLCVSISQTQSHFPFWWIWTLHFWRTSALRHPRTLPGCVVYHIKRRLDPSCTQVSVLDPISHLRYPPYPNSSTILDRLTGKLSNEFFVIFLGRKIGDLPLEAEKKASRVTQMPTEPRKSTGVLFLVTHSLSMVVLSPGVLKNRNLSPYPPLRLSMSRQHMPPRRLFGFAISSAKPSPHSLHLQLSTAITSPPSPSPPTETFMRVWNTSTSDIILFGSSSKTACWNLFIAQWTIWLRIHSPRHCQVRRQSILQPCLDFDRFQLEGECWNSSLVVMTIWLGPDRPNRDMYLFYYLYFYLSCYNPLSPSFMAMVPYIDEPIIPSHLKYTISRLPYKYPTCTWCTLVESTLYFHYQNNLNIGPNISILFQYLFFITFSYL